MSIISLLFDTLRLSQKEVQLSPGGFIMKLENPKNMLANVCLPFIEINSWQNLQLGFSNLVDITAHAKLA